MNIQQIKKGSVAFIILMAIIPSPTYTAPFILHFHGEDGIEAVPGMAVTWRQYDINGDGRFDAEDINDLIDSGALNIGFDLNHDGKKDMTDALALYVRLSVLDRNCDEAVDENDFIPVDPVTMPEPNAASVWSLVSRIVSENREKLPPDIENQIFRALPDFSTMTLAKKASIFQETGMSALLQMNLEGAQWAYGRAFQTNNRSATALGSLAFTIAVDKRHEEALTLLAYARELFHESGATSTTLGWIFARHGQNLEALIYYKEAVDFAPKVAQYHFNLGIAYLRVGYNAKAFKEFKIASELNPGDLKAFLFRHILTENTPARPIPSIDLEGLQLEYELQISELKEYGASDDELPTPWNELSPCEMAQSVVELLERRYGKQGEQTAQSYADEVAEKLNDIALTYAPEWVKLSIDWEKFCDWMQIGRKTGAAIEHNAEIALGNMYTTLARQLGNEILSYDSFYMECALKQAKSDAVMEIGELYSSTNDSPLTSASYEKVKAEIYQSSLEAAINECYKTPMITGASYLKYKRGPAALPVSHVEVYPIEFFPLAMWDSILTKPGYCDRADEPTEYFETSFDNTFSLDLWIVSFEYNSTTGEWEFRAGQGIILGASWTPETGFGFQIGVGIELDMVVTSISAGAYMECYSDKLNFVTELEGSVGYGPLKAGGEIGGDYTVVDIAQCTPQEPCPLH
jgi:tetratricopeptide (TPR) repeat protein